MSIAEKIAGTGCEIRLNAPMSEYTSFKTGGAARVLALPANEAELAAVLRICSQHGIMPFVFGNGSNLLVSDEGIDGVSIRLSGNFERIEKIDETTLYCTAGTKLASLCKFALAESLTGLEFAYGIPGTAGGAAYMNAGAYGGEMKDVLLCCNHLDMNGVEGSFSGEELKLSYRHSVYSEQPLVITGITVKLNNGEQSEINAKMQELLGRRVDKQPLDLPSAGSFFKRPEGHFAGALIEQCGLKGFSVGGAQISEKHAGFVVNKGGATTADIMALSREVSRIVFEQTGVTLEHEVKLIGNIE